MGGQDAMGPRAREGRQGLALLRIQRALEQGSTAFRPFDPPGQGPSSASGAQDTLGWRKPLLPLSLPLHPSTLSASWTTVCPPKLIIHTLLSRAHGWAKGLTFIPRVMRDSSAATLLMGP